MPDNQTSPSLPRRLLRFGIAIALFVLVMYVVAPFLVEEIAPFKKYAQTVDETGIMPGALYYTDVPQSAESEANNRDAIRYMVKDK